MLECPLLKAINVFALRCVRQHSWSIQNNQEFDHLLRSALPLSHVISFDIYNINALCVGRIEQRHLDQIHMKHAIASNQLPFICKLGNWLHLAEWGQLSVSLNSRLTGLISGLGVRVWFVS